MTHPVRKRFAVVLGCLITATVLAIFLAPGYVGMVIGPGIERILAHRALAKATTPMEMRKAVGYLGGYFPLPDSEWIAVRYADMHAYPGYSCATALDSKGRWYESDVHFCGRFKIYFQVKEMTERSAAVMEYTKEDVEEISRKTSPEIHAIATARSIEEARRALIDIGFRVQ